MPLDFHRVLCPLTEGSLYRKLLATGARNIKIMNLMALGPYEPPDGVWLPSILYLRPLRLLSFLRTLAYRQAGGNSAIYHWYSFRGAGHAPRSTLTAQPLPLRGMKHNSRRINVIPQLKITKRTSSHLHFLSRLRPLGRSLHLPASTRTDVSFDCDSPHAKLDPRSPESTPARSSRTYRWPAPHPGRARFGQDPRHRASDRLPHPREGRPAEAGAGRHVHEQGRAGDAGSCLHARRR